MSIEQRSRFSKIPGAVNRSGISRASLYVPDRFRVLKPEAQKQLSPLVDEDLVTAASSAEVPW